MEVMQKDLSILWEVSVWEFLFITVALAGGAAYLTGRTVARAWQGDARLIVYILLLTAATRFIHFALFNGTLLSVHYYIVDFIVLTVIAFIGKRVTRAGQMATQYNFEYTRRNLLTWDRKAG
jgi:hypothetical protein